MRPRIPIANMDAQANPMDPMAALKASLAALEAHRATTRQPKPHPAKVLQHRVLNAANQIRLRQGKGLTLIGEADVSGEGA